MKRIVNRMAKIKRCHRINQQEIQILKKIDFLEAIKALESFHILKMEIYVENINFILIYVKLYLAIRSRGMKCTLHIGNLSRSPQCNGGKTLVVTSQCAKEQQESENTILLNLPSVLDYLLYFQKNWIDERIIPIINTIENTFNYIVVCDMHNICSDKVFEYLMSNKNLRLEKISKEKLGCFKRNGLTADSIEIVIVMDFDINYEKNKFYEFTLSHCIQYDVRAATCDVDIVKNIAPYLLGQNVKIISLLYPELDKMNSKVVDAIKRNSMEDYRRLFGSSLFNELKCLDGNSDMRKGYKTYGNYNGKWHHIIHGKRVYSNNNRRKILLVGPCLTLGLYSKDSDTIGQYLFSLFGEEFDVELAGGYFYNLNLLLRSEVYHRGDIVLILERNREFYKKSGLPMIDLTKTYRKIPSLEREVYDNILHVKKGVNQQIARDIYEFIRMNGWERRDDHEERQEVYFGNFSKKKLVSEMASIPELKGYLNQLSKCRIQTKKSIGAIVMNCNPFTNGHRYLVEQAAGSVDYLFIFVVQEDKSFFSFKDRFALVKKGTEDLHNVKVIPSGRFIISSLTLPGYFDKDNLQQTKIDAINDLEIFATQIASVLNITKRFVGEEPFDAYTRQYNESMKEVLPQYGIELIEIPRKVMNGKAISASYVRKLYQQKEWDAIRKIVPESTYLYLFKRTHC